MNSHVGTLDNMASEERTVRKLYQDENVANQYLANRLKYTWWRQLHRVQVEAVNRVVAREDINDILEVAPGPARITAEVEGVLRGTMVEASPQMISVAKRRLAAAGKDGQWDLREGNAFDLSSLDEAYDFAYTFRFIRHFQKPERQRFYEQVHQRLRPGGLFLFDVVNARIRRQLDRAAGTKKDGLKVYDVSYHSPEEICAELAESGFEPVSVTGVLHHFRFQSWLSHKFDDLVPGVAESAIRALDRIESAHPLEWIGLFRKV
jgi:SAM-dependent methyltransferase